MLVEFLSFAEANYINCFTLRSIAPLIDAAKVDLDAHQRDKIVTLLTKWEEANRVAL